MKKINKFAESITGKKNCILLCQTETKLDSMNQTSLDDKFLEIPLAGHDPKFTRNVEPLRNRSLSVRTFKIMPAARHFALTLQALEGKHEAECNLTSLVLSFSLLFSYNFPALSATVGTVD